MSAFHDEMERIASESTFSNVQLEQLFESEAERQEFLKVQAALAAGTSSNETVQKVLGMGEGAVAVLVKVAKLALAA